MMDGVRGGKGEYGAGVRRAPVAYPAVATTRRESQAPSGHTVQQLEHAIGDGTEDEMA